jgi:hypothetical protein
MVVGQERSGPSALVPVARLPQAKSWGFGRHVSVDSTTVGLFTNSWSTIMLRAIIIHRVVSSAREPELDNNDIDWFRSVA